jgi:hypothetical protein
MRSWPEPRTWDRTINDAATLGKWWLRQKVTANQDRDNVGVVKHSTTDPALWCQVRATQGWGDTAEVTFERLGWSETVTVAHERGFALSEAAERAFGMYRRRWGAPSSAVFVADFGQ